MNRLLLGYIIREKPGDDTQGTTAATGQKARIRDGQQQARQQMLNDVGAAPS